MTVLALHGWLGRGADWDATAAYVPGVPLDAPDLPGHGSAGPAGTASMDAAADLLAARIAARHGGRAVVAGYSLGGRLALHLAARHPARVAGLVLVSASAGLRDPAEQAARRALDAERARSLRADPARFLEAWLALPLWNTLSAEQKRRILDARLAQLPGAAEGWAHALAGLSTGAQPFHGDALARLGVPVEVVAGAADARFAGIARALARTPRPDAHRSAQRAPGLSPSDEGDRERDALFGLSTSRSAHPRDLSPSNEGDSRPSRERSDLPGGRGAAPTSERIRLPRRGSDPPGGSASVRVEIVPGAGHALLVEAPGAVARAVARVVGSAAAGVS